ncbi:hypothetical protein TVAG_340490 [Trichomonas vaginalis G3]|uniref:Uncharacterized protein n=1 Tax=Trichomonas vaginalis (strain ATCC PRA-98 / G3) TaxID=412133 RepID=A2EKG3_TRIV3|nr:chitin-binding type-2 domain family [Trichomonas vaginalis G3]EAY06871.1 hypothetical protein TVAG_340490 [Trichomonas vaginalis G3]KAI5489185.1 chitin-binding type-2 domain family [Trichomonas vaginalis G3]|eukprot:XP_001319094.1 hypothetical protein [Trichomonas vaginalis G3]
MVKNRRTILAFDDTLSQVPSLSLDTKIVVLAMSWSQKFQTLYLSGNFGWVRALEVHAHTSISGTACEWEGKWTTRHNSQWMNHLVCDDTKEILFGASGTDVYIMSMNDGSLLQKFNTGHKANISGISYSPEHLMFFTAATDGIVKTWQVFEKSALNTQTIDQVRLGPIHLIIDSMSIITVSHERVIRRYNMMTGNLIGSYNLEPSVPLDMKNVEAAIDLQSAMTYKTEKKSWVFQSEGGIIRQFQACFAPKELSICSDAVVSILVDHNGKIFALSKTNIIHQLYADTHESTVYDLDTMPIANTGKPHTISVPVSEMVLHKGIIYVGFSNGEIKCFNTNNKQLFEMNEPTLGNRIDSMLPLENVMTVRHSYCKKCKKVTTLLFTSTSNGGIVMHCPTCWDYIGSWKISNIGMLHMERTPDGKYVIGLEDVVIHIYKVNEQYFEEVFTLKLDEFEIAQTFKFATNSLLVVCLDNGKGKVYELQEDLHGNPTLTLLHNMKLHNSPFTSIISSMDLLKFEGGLELIKKENLEGYVCSLGTNDTLTIADCITGIVQYTKDTPKHTTNHEMAFILAGKLMIVLGVDQNIRLLDWPDFQRIYPSPPHTPKKEEEEDKKELSSEEEDDDVVPFFQQTTNNMKNNYFSSSSSSSQEHFNLESGENNLNNVNNEPILRYPDIPPGGRKRMDLIFEDGHPKIVVEGEETYTFNLDSRPSVGELIAAPQSDIDAVMQHNANIIKKLIANDPRVAAAFQPQKKIKRIRAKKVENVDEEFFYSFFLTLDVKSVPKEVFQEMHRKRLEKQSARKSIKSISSSSARTENSQEENESDEIEVVRKIKPIKKIGNRKTRENKKKQRVFEIELEDGTIVQTNELTADILANLANSEVNDPTRVAYNASNINVPGKIFQKALKGLKKVSENKAKKPIIHLTQQVALPIQTIMPNGVYIGGSEARHFHNTKPTFYDDWIPPKQPKPYSQSMSGADFMHWEGVRFHKRPEHHGFIKNISLSEQYFDINEYDEYEEEEEEEETLESIQKRRNFVNNIFDRRRHSNLTNIEEFDQASDEFDPSGYEPIKEEIFPALKEAKSNENVVEEKADTFGEEPILSNTTNDVKASSQIQLINTSLFDQCNDSSASLFSMSGLNIFDNNNQRAQKLVNESPSLKILSDIYGASDNPLADLIKNAPPMSADDIQNLQLNKLGPLPEWTPLADTIPMESSGPQELHGFTVAGVANPNYGKGRPRSPPSGLFTLNDINNSLNVGKNFLPMISENSQEDFLLDSITEASYGNEDIEPLDSPSSVASFQSSILAKKPPTPPKPKSASVLQVEEHLKRNDFAALREVLDEVGLIEDNTLVDQPKWQPTINFLSFHQKALSNNSSTVSLLSHHSSKHNDEEEDRNSAIPETIPDETTEIQNLPSQVSTASRGSFSSLPYEAQTIEDSDGSSHTVSGLIPENKPEIKLPDSPKQEPLNRKSSDLNMISEADELPPPIMEQINEDDESMTHESVENIAETKSDESGIIQEEKEEKHEEEEHKEEENHEEEKKEEEEDSDVDIDGEIERMSQQSQAKYDLEQKLKQEEEEEEKHEEKIEEEEEKKQEEPKEEKKQEEEEEEYVEEEEITEYQTDTQTYQTEQTNVTEEEEEVEEEKHEQQKIEEEEEKREEPEEKKTEEEEVKEEKKQEEEESENEEEDYQTTSTELSSTTSEDLSNLEQAQNDLNNVLSKQEEQNQVEERQTPDLNIPQNDPLITITSHRSQQSSEAQTPKLQIAEEIGDVDLAKMNAKQAKKRPPRSRNNEKVEKVEKSDKKLSKKGTKLTASKKDLRGSKKSVDHFDTSDHNNKLTKGITMESIHSDDSNEEEETGQLQKDQITNKSKEQLPITKDQPATKLSRSNRSSAQNSTSNVSVESVSKVKAVAGNRGQGKQRRTIGRKNNDEKIPFDNTISSITEEEGPDQPPETLKKKVVKKKVVKKEEPKDSPLVNRKDQQRKEEEELLAKLMANTTEMNITADLSSLGITGQKQVVKIEKQKSRSLSSRINLDDPPESLKIINERESNERPKEKFPNYTIIRNKSSNDLLSKKEFERPRLRMMAEYETSLAPKAFNSFYAPSLWERRRGVLRRNSII